MIRQRAVDALVARGDKEVISYLAARAEGANSPLAAATALWTLVRIGTPDAMSAITDGARHSDWRVRRLAINLLRRYKVKGTEAVAQSLSNDKDPAVRVAAALAFQSPQDIRAQLVAALQAGAAEDEHLRYEAAWHLAEVADEATYQDLLASENENIRLAGLIAIDVAAYEKRPSADAAIDVLAERIAQPGKLDTKLLLEMARLHRSPKLVGSLRELVRRDDVTAATTARGLLVLRSISSAAAQNLDRQSVRRFLDAVKSGAVRIQSSDEILTLLELLETEGPSEFALAEIGRHLGQKDRRVRDAAIKLAVGFGTKSAPLSDEFWSRILDSRFKLKPEDKLIYLAALPAIESDPNREKWTTLFQEGDPLLVTDAVRSWRAFGDRPQMAKLLADNAAELIKRQPDLNEDLAAVAMAWKSSEGLPGSLQPSKLPTSDEGYRQAASDAALQKAHAALGRRVFERSGCVKCHTTVTENTIRAPSLKGIGKAQKIEYLIESVLDPSKVIKTGFETELIVTTSGKVYTGLVKKEGDQLRIIAADKEVRIARSDVDERSVQKKSLMPDGQHRTLSRREFADLIAYLRSLK